MNCLINASISSSLPSDDKIFIAPGVIEFGICMTEIYGNHEAELWGVNPIYRALQGRGQVAPGRSRPLFE
jgi:hypothetical protein